MVEEKWNKIFDMKKDYDSVLKVLASDFQKTYDRAMSSPTAELQKDYEPIKVVGTGSFGTVYLCKIKKSSKYLAIKVFIKEAIVQNNQTKHIIEERRCLASICFPFIIHLEASFKDHQFLYIGLPYINGGELYTYHRKQYRFREKEAKFYAAQTYLALEYLHTAEVIYRDLKPENILLDCKGYIKITDLGFAKKIDGKRTYTLCGTPEYLAPEVILSQPYGKSVDWWAYGILIYELVAGYLPFVSKTREDDPIEMFERICEGKYRVPSFFSSELRSLVQSLLQNDVTKRIGLLKNGAKDIKDHEWFKGMDWIGILTKDVDPFYVPIVKDAADTQLFERYSDPHLFTRKQKILDTYDEEFKDF